MSKNALRPLQFLHPSAVVSILEISRLGTDIIKHRRVPPRPCSAAFNFLIVNCSLRPSFRLPLPALHQAFHDLAAGVDPAAELGLDFLCRRAGLYLLKQCGALEVAQPQVEAEVGARVVLALRVDLGNGVEVGLYRGEVFPEEAVGLGAGDAAALVDAAGVAVADGPLPGGAAVGLGAEAFEVLDFLDECLAGFHCSVGLGVVVFFFLVRSARALWMPPPAM